MAEPKALVAKLVRQVVVMRQNTFKKKSKGNVMTYYTSGRHVDDAWTQAHSGTRAARRGNSI